MVHLTFFPFFVEHVNGLKFFYDVGEGDLENFCGTTFCYRGWLIECGKCQIVKEIQTLQIYCQHFHNHLKHDYK